MPVKTSAFYALGKKQAPYTDLLPMREQISASLVTVTQPSRSITLAGPLDPIAFWPHADTIGGSRWPGERGGPRRRH